MRYMRWLGACVLALMAAGCGAPSATPEGIVREYIAALRDGDMNSSKERQLRCISAREREEAKSRGGRVRAVKPSNLDNGELEVQPHTVDDSGNAIVTIKLKLPDNRGTATQTYVVVREGEEWKISLDLTLQHARQGTTTDARKFVKDD